MTWYERAKRRMKEIRLRQNQLASRLGVLDSTINHWLSGRNEPSIPLLVAIAYHLGVSLDWLLTDVPMTKPTINIDDAIVEAQGFAEPMKLVPAYPPTNLKISGRIRKPAGMA